jgi:hypothetical protein
VLLLAFVALPALAQEKKKAPPKKKPAPAAAKGKAHSKPSPEQIRRFNELEKKKAQ